jgi:hypothetical protein
MVSNRPLRDSQPARETYPGWLEKFLDLAGDLVSIPYDPPALPDSGPFWNNDFYPALDVLALPGFLSILRPKTLLEIGSGNTTKFAHHAIQTRHVPAEIVSIDPEPRMESTPSVPARFGNDSRRSIWRCSTTSIRAPSC